MNLCNDDKKLQAASIEWNAKNQSCVFYSTVLYFGALGEIKFLHKCARQLFKNRPTCRQNTFKITTFVIR